MTRGAQALLAILIVAGVAAGVAGGGPPQLFSFYGPYGGALCNGGGVVEGDLGDWGTARISGTSHVHAKVSMHGLDPNTTYIVRFIQGIPDCGETNATFTTDGLGRGHASMHEPAVSTHAYIFVEDIPATQFYVTQTYWHP